MPLRYSLITFNIISQLRQRMTAYGRLRLFRLSAAYNRLYKKEDLINTSCLFVYAHCTQIKSQGKHGRMKEKGFHFNG